MEAQKLKQKFPFNPSPIASIVQIYQCTGDWSNLHLIAHTTQYTVQPPRGRDTLLPPPAILFDSMLINPCTERMRLQSFQFPIIGTIY